MLFQTYLIEKKFNIRSKAETAPEKPFSSLFNRRVFPGENFEDHYYNINKTHKNLKTVINDYKNLSYDSNDELRSSKINDLLRKNIRPLDDLTSYSTKRPHDVYRGMKPEHIGNIENYIPGKIIHDKGFTGTTPDPNIATRFAPRDEHPNHVIFHIHVPKGTKGFFIDHNRSGRFSEEKEFLLRRGSHFKILGHTIHKDIYPSIHVIHMTVHHQDPIQIENNEFDKKNAAKHDIEDRELLDKLFS